MGFGSAAGKLFSECGPFGIAAVAAAGSELPGLACLAGAVLGYALTGGLYAALRYIAAVFMVFTVGFFIRGTKLYEKRWFMPAAAVVLTGGIGTLLTNVTDGGAQGLTRLFLEMVLTGGCAYLFGYVTKPESLTTGAAELRRGISVLILEFIL